MDCPDTYAANISSSLPRRSTVTHPSGSGASAPALKPPAAMRRGIRGTVFGGGTRSPRYGRIRMREEGSADVCLLREICGGEELWLWDSAIWVTRSLAA